MALRKVGNGHGSECEYYSTMPERRQSYKQNEMWLCGGGGAWRRMNWCMVVAMVAAMAVVGELARRTGEDLWSQARLQ